MNTDLVTVLWFGHSHKQLENRLRLRYERCDRVNDGCELLLWFNTCEEDDQYISSRQFIYIKYWLHTRSTLVVNSNGLLTEYSVEEGKIAQEWRVLGQSEKTSGQPVPHQSAAGVVLQHTVLDDLGKPVQKSLESYEMNLWMISYHWCSLEVIRLTSTLTRHKSHERLTFINMRPAGLQPGLFGHVLMLGITDPPFKTWPGCPLTLQQQSSTSQSCTVSFREKCVKPEPETGPM